MPSSARKYPIGVFFPSPRTSVALESLFFMLRNLSNKKCFKFNENTSQYGSCYWTGLVFEWWKVFPIFNWIRFWMVFEKFIHFFNVGPPKDDIFLFPSMVYISVINTLLADYSTLFCFKDKSPCHVRQQCFVGLYLNFTM